MTSLDKTLHCLGCGRQHHLHAQVMKHGDQPAAPSPGDCAVCFQCGYIMIYTDDIEFRKPTDEELAVIVADPRIGHMMREMREVRGDKLS